MKQLPPCHEESRVRLGKVELLSLGAALLAAVFLGLVLIVSSSSSPELFSRHQAYAAPTPSRLDGPDERPSGLRATSSSAVNIIPVATVQAPPAVDRALQEENRRLSADNQQLQGQLKDLYAWVLVNFRGKYPVPETFMSKLRIVPVNDDYTLNPELAEFLRVTSEEEEQINKALQTSAQSLQSIETATISVRSPRPDKVILSIPAFEQEGKVLQEDLYAALEGTLGGGRFDRLIQVAEQDLCASFYHFGEASRTMIFELADNGGTGPSQLIIRDAWIVPDGAQSRTIEAHESTVTNLPAHYRTYVAWLPESFTSFSAE